MYGLSAVAAASVDSAERWQPSSLARMPSTHFSANAVAVVREQADRVEQVARDQRHPDVQLEVPLHAGDRDRRVVADHLGADLQDDLRDDRVDLAGHDRGALLELRQEQLADPGARAGAHQREIVGDLRQRHRDDLQRAAELDERVAVALRLERILRRADPQVALGVQLVAHPGGELGVRVQAGAGRGAAERDLRHLRQRVADPLGAEADLRGVPGELLPERHRHRVHQVRPAGLDDVVELLRLGRERLLESLERRQQLVAWRCPARRGGRRTGTRRWRTGPC